MQKGSLFKGTDFWGIWRLTTALDWFQWKELFRYWLWKKMGKSLLETWCSNSSFHCKSNFDFYTQIPHLDLLGNEWYGWIGFPQTDLIYLNTKMLMRMQKGSRFLVVWSFANPEFDNRARSGIDYDFYFGWWFKVSGSLKDSSEFRGDHQWGNWEQPS